MQTWTAGSWAAAVLAAGVLSLTLLPPALSAGGKGAGDHLAAFRNELARRCAEGPLRGAWVKSVTRDKGGKGLALAVLVDDPAQVAPLEGLANKLLKQ